MIIWRCEFSSERFLPLLPQDCQVNPGAYGFELAWWLAQQLQSKGMSTSYPMPEDWGWLLDFAGPDDIEYTIGCASPSSPEQGYDGKPVEWSLFVRPNLSHLSLVRRFKGHHRSAVIETNRIGSLIDRVLLEAGVDGATTPAVD